MFKAQDVLDRWRRAGRRITAPRKAILEALEGDTTHPSAEEVLRRVRRRRPTLSFTTVYSTLEALVREGVIARLATDPSRVRFDANVDEHDHLVCDRCGRIADVPASGGARRRHVAGFSVTRVRLEYRGLCRTCQD